MILDKQIKIGTQQRMAHKRNLKKGTRIDSGSQSMTLKYLCRTGYFEFASQILTTNDSMSSSTYLKFITKKQPVQNLKNRGILILEFKNRIRNFKNTME